MLNLVFALLGMIATAVSPDAVVYEDCTIDVNSTSRDAIVVAVDKAVDQWNALDDEVRFELCGIRTHN